MRPKISLKSYHLPILVLLNSMILVLGGLFIPRYIVQVGFLVGFITFYLVFSIEEKRKLVLDVYLIVTVLASSLIGSIFLAISCEIYNKLVCSPNFFRAQIFGNFIFPLIFVVFLWISERLLLVFKKK